MIHLGTAIRSIRKRLGIPQRIFGEYVGISYPHICNVENEHATPSFELLDKFHDILGIDIYVYAYCSSDHVQKLPKNLRQATRKLLEAFDKEIERIHHELHADKPRKLSTRHRRRASA